MTAVTGWGMFVTYKLQRVIAMATEQIRVESGVLQRALKHKPKYLNVTGFFSQLIKIRALYVLGFWFILQFINSTMMSSQGGGVAYAAHILSLIHI